MLLVECKKWSWKLWSWKVFSLPETTTNAFQLQSLLSNTNENFSNIQIKVISKKYYMENIPEICRKCAVNVLEMCRKWNGFFLKFQWKIRITSVSDDSSIFHNLDIFNDITVQLLMTVFVLDFLDYDLTVFRALSQIVLGSLIPLAVRYLADRLAQNRYFLK